MVERFTVGDESDASEAIDQTYSRWKRRHGGMERPDEKSISLTVGRFTSGLRLYVMEITRRLALGRGSVSGGILLRGWLAGFRLREALLEDLVGCAALHLASQVRALGIVLDKVEVQVGLHRFGALIPGWSPLGTEVLIEQRPVQSFDEAVRMWASGLRRL